LTQVCASSLKATSVLFFFLERGLQQPHRPKAVEYLRLLQTSLDSTNKAILLKMADAWISFAEQK
jgi:hypothetical protein